MLKNSFKLAFRNLWKRKASTAINIVGLGIGLACCALVFLYFQHEISFDRGFKNSDEIYRITTTFNDGYTAPTVGFSYANYLKSEIPEVEDVARLDPTMGSVVVEAVNGEAAIPYIEDSGYWVDPNFFELLSFHFLYGNNKTALAAPNTIVISQSLSSKLFKRNYPVGRALKVGRSTYTVTGVFKEDFLNHIKADFFASNKSDIIRQTMINNTSWVVNDNCYTYVRLQHGADISHVTTELNAYLQRHAGDELKAHSDHMTNSLQALKDIHLNSTDFVDYLAYKQGNIKYLFVLISIALIILLLASINYINLSTALALSRAKEVGVRRVLGAEKWAIRYQFLIETIVIGFFALLFSILFALIFLPVFNDLTGQTLSFLAPENHSLIFWMILIALLTGLLSGLYPAFYLSAFKPVLVLKGKIADKHGKFNLRKLLILSQFVLATCFLFATLVIWEQLHFMLGTKPGFDQDQQLVINLTGDQAQTKGAIFASLLEVNSNFKSVTIATGPLISGDLSLFPAKKTIAEKQSVFLDFADGNYLKTLGLQLVSGHNFDQQTFTNANMLEDMELHDIGNQIILNEEAAKILGFDAVNAVGNFVSHLHDGKIYNYKIVGVVKDYHYFSLHAPIGPCAIMNVNRLRCNTIIAKINGRHTDAAMRYAAAQWKTLNPDTPFSYGFLNKIFQSDYVQDQRQQKMMEIFSGLAIFISCLGLLGLITFALGQKIKEIAVRKVIGASATNIILMFYNQYLKLVVLANMIALPLAWYLMKNWLNDFPYHITISWWIFVASLSAGLLIAFCTIAFKTFRAARVNPVDSLRAD